MEKIKKSIFLSFSLAILVIGFFGGVALAQLRIVSQEPPDKSFDNTTNTAIRIQFSETMNTSLSWFNLEDNDYNQDIPGTVSWRTTTYPNDTLEFVPHRSLKPVTHYLYEGVGISQAGGRIGFEASFITKPSTADSTPPTVQTHFPFNGMTNVSTGGLIYIKFSEAMNPPSTTTPGNILLGGPGISGPGDYIVEYEFEEGFVNIKKNTPFSPNSTYTVTITTKVKDLRGNRLRDQYQWSFTTGPADTTPPTVVQTIPANNDGRVSIHVNFHVIFSEEMDESSLNSTNITLHDNTSSTNIPIQIWWTERNYVSFGTNQDLTNGHNYTVTIGTGVKDIAGNSLASSYQFSFTVANSGEDSDPVINWGVYGDDHIGYRMSDGTTRIELYMGALDELTDPLTIQVTDLTQPGKTWNLTKKPGEFEYKYISPGDEGLNPGDHFIEFSVKDGADNEITFRSRLFIFDSFPSLSSPSNGQTGISTTPTLQWSYNGSIRPFIHAVRVMAGPDPDSAPIVWQDFIIDDGPRPYSLTIPKDKALAPFRTYYWVVVCFNYQGNGWAISEIRSFTTGGSPYPPPRFSWWVVRSDDRPTGMLYSLGAKVIGPSPADIVELKVTGPGGFQYIFSEDDIMQSELDGFFFWKIFTSTLQDGTYTFTVTDSMGRIASKTYDFTFSYVPRVDSGTMQPANNSYLNTTTPTFSWGAVSGCSGCAYRVTVFDWNFQEASIYMSPYITSTQITVPLGFLLPNTAYKWRVEVYDSTRRNRSVSATFGFSTGRGDYTLDLKGIVWAENDYYGGERKSVQVLISNAGINEGPLPDDVTSLRVEGPGFIRNFPQSDIRWARTVGNAYVYGEPVLPQNGAWQFNISDRFGRSDDYSKDQTSGVIPIVDYMTMSPANNVYLHTLTPTFSWNPVSGSPRYYRIAIMDWRTKYVIYQSSRSIETSLTIPSGILKWYRAYKWRVEVYDNQDGLEADNRSTSMWFSFSTFPKNIVDYDGDGKTDIAVYRIETGAWYVIPSSNPSTPYGLGWGGNPTDKPVPGDYDGDGKTDIAVYRTETGAWYVIPSSNPSTPYGLGWGGNPTDKPVPGDYDGDGKTDIAVYRTETGAWYVIPSSNPSAPYGLGWGGNPTDKPVPGDYDGDGKTDIAVYRIETGAWYVIPSSNPSTPYGLGWGGNPTDKPVPGDYDGDGKTDIAVYRTETGAWYVIPSSNPSAPYGLGWGGNPTDKPVPGDYDGDGKTDIAVYRTETGAWYVIPSSNPSAPYGLGWGGNPTDIPVTMNLSSIE